MSLDLYDARLRTPGPSLTVRYADGGSEPLGLARWTGALSMADETLLVRCRGPVLDIGCGPGRFTAGLAERRVDALGIDVAPAAVALTRQRGGSAVRRSVFEELPEEGRWSSALLADGNIGIGGNPVRLLRRASSLLMPAGRVLVELSPPGGGTGGGIRARLESACGASGTWFSWARVGLDRVVDVAYAADLELAELWSARDSDASWRHFAMLVQPSNAR